MTDSDDLHNPPEPTPDAENKPMHPSPEGNGTGGQWAVGAPINPHVL